jgi:diaminopimelate epimerase
MATRFVKMHGLGNDFVIIDGRAAPVLMPARRVRALADRKRGIGCDQLILLEPADDADLFMRIWNPDGSEAEACGNATRCVAAMVGGEARIRTRGGLLRAERRGDGITVDMGIPRFGWDEVPLSYPMDTRVMPVAWETLSGPSAVSMGNPHVVFFVDDVAGAPLDQLGPEIEADPLFPERVNVNVATVETRARLRLRVWERGAGLTLACGSGACATFAAARRRGLVEPEAVVSQPGGELLLAEGEGGHVLMTGPVETSFIGETDL